MGQIYEFSYDHVYFSNYKLFIRYDEIINKNLWGNKFVYIKRFGTPQSLRDFGGCTHSGARVSPTQQC